MDNILKMVCVAIEDRDGYFMIYLHVNSNNETNKYNTIADGTIAFAVPNELVVDFEVGKFYDLNLQEVVSE